MESLVLGVQLLLAATFAIAGIGKLADIGGTRATVIDFGVPRRMAAGIAPLLPLAEIAVAAALIPASTARWAALAAALLLLTFAAGITNAMARGRTPDCNCFGRLHSAPVGGRTLVRNLGLATLAGLVVVQRPETDLGDWIAARATGELIAFGAATAGLALTASTFRRRKLKRKGQRAIAEAGSVLHAAPEPASYSGPEGLPVGAPAPNFELDSLQGERRTLESLRGEDRPMVLAFMDPGCGPCHGLAPHLARWQSALIDRIAIVVVSEGDLDRAREAWNGHQVEILLDPNGDVTRRLYRVLTWPSALAIGRDGRIAHELAYSQDTMEAMIRTLLRYTAPMNAPPRAVAGVGEASAAAELR